MPTKNRRKPVPRPGGLPDRRVKWHIDKTVSLAHIFSALLLAGGLGGPILLWGRAMEARVLTVETNQQQADKRESQRDEFAKEQRAQAIDQLRRLEAQGIAMQVSIAEVRAQLSAQLRNERK
jgi:hypothetical protein